MSDTTLIVLGKPLVREPSGNGGMRPHFWSRCTHKIRCWRLS